MQPSNRQIHGLKYAEFCRHLTLAWGTEWKQLLHVSSYNTYALVSHNASSPNGEHHPFSVWYGSTHSTLSVSNCPTEILQSLLSCSGIIFLVSPQPTEQHPTQPFPLPDYKPPKDQHALHGHFPTKTKHSFEDMMHMLLCGTLSVRRLPPHDLPFSRSVLFQPGTLYILRCIAYFLPYNLYVWCSFCAIRKPWIIFKSSSTSACL